jgi:hypothetical protein
MRSVWVALTAVGFLVAGVGGKAWAESPAPEGFFLRLSPGVVYLHESWTPASGSPGAVFSGAGASLELAVGKRVRPRLVVGGLWQFVAVSDPTESYLGATYVAAGTDRFRNVVAAFADWYPSARRGFHVGGGAGVVAASNLERHCCVSTSWGGVVAVRVGYDVFVSRRWALGAVAQVEAYRYSAGEAGVSAASNGVLPTVAVAVTFEPRRDGSRSGEAGDRR